MLRHALQLGYHDVSVVLHEVAGIFSPAQRSPRAASRPVPARPRDGRPPARAATSRSTRSRRPSPATPPRPSARSSPSRLGSMACRVPPARAARGARTAESAADRPPRAGLRRSRGHLRLPARRLAAGDRDLPAGADARPARTGRPGRQGLHLGAYAWLEDLRPEGTAAQPVALTDPELAARPSAASSDPPLARDPTNQGYVHAPSLNHAVAAAVLRNGYHRQRQRARTAGRAGDQPDLRAGADRRWRCWRASAAARAWATCWATSSSAACTTATASPRSTRSSTRCASAFPLRGGRLASTKPPEGMPIEAIEARNVIDGLAFAEHLKATGSTAYPFGKAGLPTATPAAGAGHRRRGAAGCSTPTTRSPTWRWRRASTRRCSATTTASPRPTTPTRAAISRPSPTSIRTPRHGIGLTSGSRCTWPPAPPAVSPIAGLPMTPRAQAEPAVNAWLAAQLPPLGRHRLRRRRSARRPPAIRRPKWRSRSTSSGCSRSTSSLIVGDDGAQRWPRSTIAWSASRVTSVGPRPDVPVAIGYMRTQTAPISVFAALPLFRALRRLVTAARPLRPTDLALTRERHRRARTSRRRWTRARLTLVRDRARRPADGPRGVRDAAPGAVVRSRHAARRSIAERRRRLRRHGGNAAGARRDVRGAAGRLGVRLRVPRSAPSWRCCSRRRPSPTAGRRGSPSSTP